jgi:hypothetical protein
VQIGQYLLTHLGNKSIATIMAIASTLALPSIAAAVNIKITVDSLTPAAGGIVTPLWYSFHDGSFNTFDLGAPASTGIEHIAEDGFTGLESPETLNFLISQGLDPNDIFPREETLAGIFDSSSASQNGGIQNFIAARPFGFRPGETASQTLILNNSDRNRYFSYAAMYFPSNDAFIGDETGVEIFDDRGNFIGADFTIYGSNIWDAGTEINDENPSNVPYTLDLTGDGITETGVVARHQGFLPTSSGGVLDFGGGVFANSNFDATTPIARIRIERVEDEVSVPEPNITIGLLLLLTIFLFGKNRSIYQSKNQ